MLLAPAGPAGGVAKLSDGRTLAVQFGAGVQELRRNLGDIVATMWQSKQMSGKDEETTETADLRAELTQRTSPVQWSDLRAHAVRDALFLVDNTVDLVEVALAIANDETSAVQAWLDTGQLTRPTEQQLKCWNDAPQRLFRSAIVQPFVVARPLDN